MKRKIIFITILLFLICLYNIFSEEKEYISRKIAIIPFSTNNENTTNNMETLIRNNLYRNLQKNFTVTDISAVDESFKSLDFNKDTILRESDIEKFAIDNDVDVIVYGNISAVGGSINITIQTYDILTNEVIVKDTINKKHNSDLFRKINVTTQSHSISILEKLHTYNPKLIEILQNMEKQPEAKKIILKKLLSQENKYWDIFIEDKNIKSKIKIPFAKNVIILISKISGDYTVETGDKKNDKISKIKLFAFENSINENRLFKISNNKNISFIYKYIQKKAYDVNVKYIEFINEQKKMDEYSFFIDSGIVFTTSGYAGGELKLGMGLPIKSNLENSLYIRFFIGPKAVNFVKYDDKLRLEYPHLKIKASLGFEHIFYIKNIIGIHLGLDVGAELSFLFFLIKDQNKIELDTFITGTPSITVSIPFSIEIMANQKFSFIIGAEPVLRFVPQYFYYEGDMWLENLDESRGASFDIFRQKIGDYLVLDLFFYDMPVFMYLRIKL